MDTEQQAVAISDPGEIGRAYHNIGDRLVVAISNLAAWIFPILMVAIVSQVLMRNLGQNQAWLDDLQWWLYGVAVLAGVAYAVTTNSHVRVDIFYDNYPRPRQVRVNLFALGWLFLPFIILAWDVTVGYALQSVVSDEGSDSPNGLHNLWILKILMNVSFILIALACWSALIRNLKEISELKLWRILWAALPATFFTINLLIYYGLLGIIWLISPAGTSGREISRHAVFDEVEIGNIESSWTIIAGLVVTALVVGGLRMLQGPAAPVEGQ
ncbi:TRAP transporter small permease subunit [Gymnodinialimonas sp. 2305UL16-5]|uniref:TRAP transporter small permease subunit n=1 Tax=Gymnodinialimonas mytili TaxID=3126503 RepID=UPI003099BF99